MAAAIGQFLPLINGSYGLISADEAVVPASELKQIRKLQRLLGLINNERPNLGITGTA